MLNYHECLVIQSSSSNQLISHINNHLFERPRKKLISNTSQSEILQLDASAEKIKLKILQILIAVKSSICRQDKAFHKKSLLFYFGLLLQSPYTDNHCYVFGELRNKIFI